MTVSQMNRYRRYKEEGICTYCHTKPVHKHKGKVYTMCRNCLHKVRKKRLETPLRTKPYKRQVVSNGNS